MAKHPMQNIVSCPSAANIKRFEENKIVRYLLDNGGISLNTIGGLPFPVEDREQFAQLIGYSINGFCELSYVREEVKDLAENMMEAAGNFTEEQLRMVNAENTVSEIKKALGPLTKMLFIPEEDFEDQEDCFLERRNSELEELNTQLQGRISDLQEKLLKGRIDLS